MIQAEGLVVSYVSGWRRRAVKALAGLDLSVAAGECVALLGHNGAGKSTAFACFLGLLRPTAGRVTILGAAPEPGAAIFRDIGYLPEEPLYHTHLTVREALTYYGRLHGVTDVDAASAPILERLDLARSRDVRVAHCSKGMKQKLGIAQCLLHAPRLLFLDEPMRGLDPSAVAAFRDMLQDANREGTTIVMSSHLLGEVEQLARRVAILDRGRLVALDTVANLTRQRTARYAVAIAATETPPAELQQPARVDGEVRGVVAPEALPAFFECVRDERLTLISCALERVTLEEAYMGIVAEASHGRA